MKWGDGIPLDPTSYGYKPRPPYTDLELETYREITWNDVRYVKIPQVPGRIHFISMDKDETLRSVEYIYERTYIEKDGKKESRNRKVIIGYEIAALRGWMCPKDCYDRYFDKDGQPIPQEEKADPEEETEKAEAEAESQREITTVGDGNIEAGKGVEIRQAEKEKASQEKPPNNPEENRKEAKNNETPVRFPTVKNKKQAEKIIQEAIKIARNDMIEQERARLENIQEDEMTEEEREEYEQLQEEEFLRQKREERNKLSGLFHPQYNSIATQAKKNPDAIVSLYKVHKLNQLLVNIRDFYQGTIYADYLELIEEPVLDEEGRIVSGMTYSDVNILLNAYDATLDDYALFYS